MTHSDDLHEEKRLSRYGEFIKFGLVGISNTVVYWFISSLITGLLNQKIDKSYLVGNTIAFIVSVYWSFVWNRRFVFQNRSTGKEYFKSLIRAYITYSFTGIILYNILSWLWIDVLDISYLIAPILNSVIGFPVNYVLNKKWTFGKGEGSARDTNSTPD